MVLEITFVNHFADLELGFRYSLKKELQNKKGWLDLKEWKDICCTLFRLHLMFFYRPVIALLPLQIFQTKCCFQMKMFYSEVDACGI